MAKLSVDRALLQAQARAKKGKIKEAKTLYQAVLQAFPNNKRAQQGLTSLNTLKQPAATQEPPQDTINQLINLYNQGQLIVVLEQAKILIEQYPEAFIIWNILGAANKGIGRVQAASEAFKKVTELNPAYADGFNNMGNILTEQGKLDEAIEAYRKAIAIKPNYAEPYFNIGNVLRDQGKLEEATVAYGKALNIRPDNAEAFNNMGIVLKDQGKLKEATAAYRKALAIKPNYAEALYNIGNALKNQDKLEESIAAYNDALAIKPDYAEAYYNIAIALKDQDKLEEAVVAYSKALAINPNYAEALYNMGNILFEQGKLGEATAAYSEALTIKPDYAEAYHNMGSALKDQDKLEESIAAYNDALAIKPDYAEAYYNIAIALKDQDKLEDSIVAYSKALAINPNYAEALYNMGNILFEQGKLGEATAAYSEALTIKPDYAEAYYNMGNAIGGIVFKEPNTSLQKTITSLLDQKSFVRPSSIVGAALSLLKLDPKLKRHLQSSALAEVELNLLAIINDLSSLPLLLKLMSICPLPDLDLENLLTKIRASLLLSVSDLTDTNETLKFQSALSLQCFTNEYIYNQTQKEEEAILAIESAIKHTLGNGDQPSPQSILCLASYRPLSEYQWSSSLRSTNEIEDVFTRQIVEPNQETKLKSILPVLEEITNDVSSKVREQYELSPYPRWVNPKLRLQPGSVSKVTEELKLKLFDNAIKDIEEPNILIAGCGTGQHSIETAARFKGANVLAIDLSLSSLSYAKRKTDELGSKNIDYMQADILDLGKLGRQFDIVESAGVLHHMDDPVAGWRVLTDCLKPGGLMKIGLYSELARQNILEMRHEISNAGIGSSNTAMKSFRTTVMTSDKNHHKRIHRSNDFYSLSTLKDLLFHVQEHRFTIPQIQKCLVELGLKFCGFEANKIVSDFKLIYAGADDAYNLERWQAYEEANPETFVGMYQFWCQKLP